MNYKLIEVELRGIKPIMFDRFISTNGKQEIAPEEKFYFDANKNLCIPSTNIMSFLTADLTESATKRTLGRKWKNVAKACMCYVEIIEDNIPIQLNGINLNMTNSNFYVRNDVAKVKKGGGLIVPIPKQRPVIPEWELKFTIKLVDNPDVTENTLRNIFAQGGITTGLGTYRGVFGKFEIINWN